MAYVELSQYVFDCAVCHTRCDGVSKGVYLFNNDSAFSEHYENIIINRINTSSTYKAAKSIVHTNPDIEIRSVDNNVYRFLEVKVQQRTFMGIEKYLQKSRLLPSETVALNLSDLIRYFEIEQRTGIPVSIVWVLLNRPCIVQQNGEKFYYQQVQKLKKIYEAELLTRKFTRKSGEGDIVEGKHKGVTVNYHFSLKELIPWKF